LNEAAEILRRELPFAHAERLGRKEHTVPDDPRMKLRIATFVVLGIDAAAAVVIGLATFLSGSDPATKGLDRAAGSIMSALFLVTAVPAFILLLRRRAPVIALLLALAFPALIVAALVAAVVVFV
jgi:hypothetical protein